MSVIPSRVFSTFCAAMGDAQARYRNKPARIRTASQGRFGSDIYSHKTSSDFTRAQRAIVTKTELTPCSGAEYNLDAALCLCVLSREPSDCLHQVFLGFPDRLFSGLLNIFDDIDSQRFAAVPHC